MMKLRDSIQVLRATRSPYFDHPVWRAGKDASIRAMCCRIIISSGETKLRQKWLPCVLTIQRRGPNEWAVSVIDNWFVLLSFDFVTQTKAVNILTKWVEDLPSSAVIWSPNSTFDDGDDGYGTTPRSRVTSPRDKDEIEVWDGRASRILSLSTSSGEDSTDTSEIIVYTRHNSF